MIESYRLIIQYEKLAVFLISFVALISTANLISTKNILMLMMILVTFKLFVSTVSLCSQPFECPNQDCATILAQILKGLQQTYQYYSVSELKLKCHIEQLYSCTSQLRFTASIS